jgi:2-polyprenyl-3-methyl-5-hydroxy-6-metoxy-1,4-benzoquinol methylase
MDKPTLDYYALHANEVAQRYEVAPSPLAHRFAESFSSGGRILDIGCGSGRDLAQLHKQGFQPYGVDGTEELVQLAQMLHPELKGRVVQGLLPDLSEPFGDELFDGVLCCAVLMHIDSTELFNAALSIKRCLKFNGRLLISVPSQRSDTGDGERDANGRLFKTYPSAYLRLIFERLGFSLIGEWGNSDAMTRQGIEWVSLLFQLKSEDNTRPIDQIEGVLNHDMKTATYKFALFRALAEIATQSPNNVKWLANGKVALPVRYVAEKWLQYYWPLIESKVFMPQINAETPDADNWIKFRRSLGALISLYVKAGGYSGFRIERNKGALSTEKQKLLKQVMSGIASAIVTGPVKYAGGALVTGRVFEYDSATKSILIPNDLWIELSHLGYWVSQAVILQWAEKTTSLGNGIDVGSVVGLLLNKEDIRSTAEARRIFSTLPNLECVWTGVNINSNFEIDHVIPFDLWHNNDAWNLLPVSKASNSKKSNKLPSSELLKRRKDRIVSYWEMFKCRDESKFKKEAETLLNLPDANWQNALFAHMSASIEMTALQRGVQRYIAK